MHAEICPVCRGSGKKYVWLANPHETTALQYQEVICNGCDGKGWITVVGSIYEEPYYPNYPVIIYKSDKPTPWKPVWSEWQSITVTYNPEVESVVR